ncbi:MAG: phycobilisome rod-core linker polypeptide [Roseofilum sp. SID1]|uniref:phycobilisome rod-core linker polypeptide n=1 Tax=Roseofilum sp. SID1 TaxID=2821497 RepID=UPI001B06AF36|nr:phycobilisome rod-core linker polypeptide [Roseofilum sp. SID1]MBP0036748.1 phycobilisome rod-core linker polypeptide [Roseofilum sp. SID1]
MGNLTTATLGLDAFEIEPLELRPNADEGELEQIVRAVYKQVLGNQHLMEGDRLSSAESLLRNGDITVRDFVRAVAQSSLYQDLFFHSSPQYRFIELNFKHFLGRAPQSQEEIAEHVQIYNQQGYAAEIDSYIDSEEYVENFGDHVAPYPRSIRSVVGLKNETFNRMFSLLRGPAANDSGNSARLITSIAANVATPIELPTVGNGASYGNTEKRFRIVFSSSKAAARLNKLTRQECLVNYSQMSQEVQIIHKRGGKILKVTELV